MTGRVVEIKSVKARYNETDYQIIVDGEVRETLFNEPMSYVTAVAREYERYGMPKAKWLDMMISEGKIRPEDRWKY